MRARYLPAIFVLLTGLGLSGCESLPAPFARAKPGPSSANADPVASEATPESTPTPLPAEALPAATDLNWNPSLDAPRERLESLLTQQQESGASQQEINKTLSSIAYLYDAELYLLFKDTLDYLPPKAQRHEVEVQNRWLDQRQQVMTQAFLIDQDGEIARYTAGQAFIAETRKRIKELQQLRKLIVIE
jgi:uncharacterized protein YecT (DUF1311 family)